MQHQSKTGADCSKQQRKVVSDDMPVHQPWYVVYTEARKEAVAVLNLERQRFHVYLPLYKIRGKRSGGSTMGNAAFEPMFPRYMFFQPSTRSQSLSCVRSTRGVVSIVRFGSEFAQVSQEVISAIREHEETRRNADLSTDPVLRPGTSVKVNNPLLNGLEGLVHSVSSQRIVVLMEILGRQTKVKVDRESIQVA